MHRITLVACVLLAGCAAGHRATAPADAARVVSLTALPPLTSLTAVGGVKLEALFLVRQDGSVEDVRLLESSGDLGWDRTAADSLRRWKFVFASSDSARQSQWVRTTLIVQVQDPVVITLGELTADSRHEADSLYTLLKNGADFTALAKEARTGAPNQCGWFLGTVDIARYPRHIRDALRRLAVNDITPPIQIDSRFAIFKRLEPPGK